MNIINGPIKALFEDPKIKEIRDAVSQKNDGVPFMLLPVRVETRFKQIEKVQNAGTVNIESLLEGLGFIHVMAIDILQQPNANNLRELISQLNTFNTAIKPDDTILIKEKGWLKQLFADLKKDVDRIISLATTGFANEAAQLHASLNATGNAILNYNVTEDVALQKVKTFIYEFESLVSAITNLTGPRANVPYLNIKNKKDLYNYITTILQNTTAFYSNALQKISDIKYIAASQATKIKDLHNAMKTVIATAHQKIIDLNKEHNDKPDEAWVAFGNTVVKENITAIKKGIKKFDTEVLPVLNAIPAPPPMETGDLIIHGVQTLVKIKKYNTAAATGYEKNKRFKKYIQPRIDTLLKIAAKPVEETKPGQGSIVKSMYASLNESLATTASIISNYQPKNNSQKFGLGLINTFIKDKASVAFGSFSDVVEGDPFPKAVFNPKPPVIQNQLWVRIYPDDIFVDTHEEAITQNEINAGKQFWKVWWAGSHDADMEMAAWKTLCTALGTKRASWVARLLKPLETVPKNVKAYKTRPSAKITDSTQLLNSGYDLLKKIAYSNTPLQIFQSAENNTTLDKLLANINKAISLVKTLHEEQDYLIEKFKSSFIKTASYINILIEKSKQLTEPEAVSVAPALERLKIVTTRFNRLQEIFLKIKAVAQSAFIEKLAEPFIYPVVATKDKDWSVTPHCLCLPDKFVVITVKDNVFCHIATGNVIAETIPVGLNPAKFEDENTYTVDENGDLQIDEDLKWMTDYNVALEKGMAVTLDITQQQFNQGFDKVIVLGVKNADSANSKLLVEDLFTNHIYAPDGMGFLKVATPTNNTQYRKSGYAGDNDVSQRYDIEIANKTFSASPADVYATSDGKRLSDALGIDYKILGYANDGSQKEVSNALAANRVFWNGSLGHYMEEMFDNIFTYDNIRRTENLFTNHCYGRGSLPSVRIGVQPYGILPTTAFSKLQLQPGLPELTKTDIDKAEGNRLLKASLNIKLQQRYEMRLQKLLNTLYGEFKILSNEVVNYSNLHNGKSTASRFVEMLCLHPVSLNYTYRQSINIARGPNASPAMLSSNFTAGDAFGPNGLFEVYKNLMMDGVFYPSFNFIDELFPDADKKKQMDYLYSRIQQQFSSSRHFGNRFIDITPEIKGPIADVKPLTFTDPLSNNIPKPGSALINYIQWLLENFADTILAGNDPANMPSHSLLFLMLRQSLLQAYQEAALNIFQQEKMINEADRRLIGSRYQYHFRKWDFGDKKYYNKYITKWHLLFKHVDALPELLRDSSFSTFPFFNYLLSQNFKSAAHYLDQLLKVPLTSIKPAELNTLKYFDASHRVYFEKLHTIRYALKQLQDLPGAELEMLLGEHVDITTYRLDAWLLSLVNQRLQVQRAKQPKGIYLGAYGYVENLRPDAKKTDVTASVKNGFKLKEGTIAYHDEDNQGFIHAGSIGQAVTAAVLRSAYATNVAGEDEPNRLSVNLSSARVRMALNLISGMRNGQSVGALLGFQFERGLHERYAEAEMDKFIQPFRKAFPLKQQVEETAGSSAVYESLTVDGNAMLQLVFDSLKWYELKSDKTVGQLLKENNFAALPSPIKQTINVGLGGANINIVTNIIVEEIDRMADALDSLGDLATCESVYQIVKGNYVRAAAVLDALAQGKSLPDPQVIETFRSGIVVTQRVLLNLQTNIVGGKNTFIQSVGWSSTPTQRAKAEPSLNYWLGSTLGSPANYKCQVVLTDKNSLQTNLDFSLDELGLQPIDIFQLNGNEDELRNVITFHILNSEPAGTTCKIDFKTRPGSWNAEDKTISELFYFIRNARNLFADSKYSGAGDLQFPDTIADASNAGLHDADDLSLRMSEAFTVLQTLYNDIKAESFVDDVLKGTTAADKVVLTSANYIKIIQHLNRSRAFGISNAVIDSFLIKAEGNDHFATAFNQLLSALKEITNRVELAKSLNTSIPAIDKPALKIEKFTELAKLIFGKSMLVIPTYTPANITELNDQLTLPAASGILRNSNNIAVEDWMHGVGKVRSRVKYLEQCIQTADMFGTALPAAAPLQLPYKNDDHWLGLPYPSDYVPSGDKLSIVLLNSSLLSSQTVQAGLIIDEWLEIIPGKTETSGIVFNYNQPNATPPQSILLAVTPNITNEWEWDDLVHTIIDTVELSKIRAVEPDHLDRSYLSHALHGVVSEIPPPQVAGEDKNALGVQAVMDFSFVQ